jgi:type I restriction enzyme S subunit
MNADTFLEQFATFAEAPNGVAKLRELVLQLAVQGKLVSHDDPANHSVEAEKAIAISKLSIRRHPETTPVDVAELAFVLPPSWIAVRLGDLAYSCPTAYGEAPSPGLVKLGVIKVGNVSNEGGFKGTFEERGFPSDEVESLQVREGDLIVVKSSGSAENVHSGKTAICRTEQDGLLVGTNFVMRLRRFGDSTLPEFLWRVLISRTTRAWVERTVQTMTYPNLKWSDYSQLPIALPPLAEQKRIVAKVDQLLALCDELAARQEARRVARAQLVGATLDRLVSTRSAADLPPHVNRLKTHFDHLFDTPTTIPQLRQTILQLAVQGQLVPQDPNDEPAKISVSRAEKERQRLISNGELREDKTLVSPPIDIGDGIPTGWCNVRLGHITNCLDHIRKPVSKAERELRSGDASIPYYGANGQVGWIDQHIFDEDLVLVVEDESFIGRVKPFSYRVTGKCWVNNHAHVLQPMSAIDPDYLNTALSYYPFTPLTSGTTNRKKLTKVGLLNAPLCIPPLAEQKRIVAKVTELLSLCDTLEAQLQTAESASTELLSAAVHHLLCSSQDT